MNNKVWVRFVTRDKKYKEKTIEIPYENIKSDFWVIPGAYDLDKVCKEIKKQIPNVKLLQVKVY